MLVCPPPRTRVLNEKVIASTVHTADNKKGLCSLLSYLVWIIFLLGSKDTRIVMKETVWDWDGKTSRLQCVKGETITWNITSCRWYLTYFAPEHNSVHTSVFFSASLYVFEGRQLPMSRAGTKKKRLIPLTSHFTLCATPKVMLHAWYSSGFAAQATSCLPWPINKSTSERAAGLWTPSLSVTLSTAAPLLYKAGFISQQVEVQAARAQSKPSHTWCSTDFCEKLDAATIFFTPLSAFRLSRPACPLEVEQLFRLHFFVCKHTEDICSSLSLQAVRPKRSIMSLLCGCIFWTVYFREMKLSSPSDQEKWHKWHKQLKQTRNSSSE